MTLIILDFDLEESLEMGRPNLEKTLQIQSTSSLIFKT